MCRCLSSQNIVLSSKLPPSLEQLAILCWVSGSFTHLVKYAKAHSESGVALLCSERSKLQSGSVITVNPITNPPAGEGESVSSVLGSWGLTKSWWYPKHPINFSSRKRTFQNVSLCLLIYYHFPFPAFPTKSISFACISFHCCVCFPLWWHQPT